MKLFTTMSQAIVCATLLGGVTTGAYSEQSESAEATVYHSEVIADRLLDREWTEGWDQGETRYSEAATRGGLLRVYLSDSVEWDEDSLRVNGRTLAELRETFEVPWHRRVVLDETLGVAKLEIRFHDLEMINRNALVVVNHEGQRFRHRVSPRRLPASLGYAAVDRAAGELVLFITRQEKAVSELEYVRLNHQALTPADESQAIQWYGNVGRIVAPLDDVPGHGRPQFVEVGLAGTGGRAIALAGDFRVLDRPFSVGMYFGDLDELAELGFNTKLDYHPRLTEDALNEYSDRGMYLLGRVFGSRYADTAEPEVIAEHPAIYALYGFDEPDVKDYRVEDVPLRRRVGVTGMEVEEQQRRFRSEQPNHLTYVVVDHTFKPFNWHTYGPISDIMAIDPYPFVMTQEIRDGDNFKEAIGDVAQIMRRASEPRPMFATLGLHYFEERGGRMPDERELRSQLYWALAEGSKGVNYYSWHFHRGGGLGDYPELHPYMAELNALCNELGDRLLYSQPSNGVYEVSEGVDARILVGRDGSLLVFAIARDAADDLEATEVVVRMPAIDDATVEVVDGDAQLKHSLDGDRLRLNVSATRPGVIVRVGP
ncbi:hypothetical protein ACERK3_09315 [Phycisphaerales bacterium AB-hyl4]|uniref:Glycoside hydrolase 123 C-terminal domain-containing protein n=1 Tax=Natronomicrosphaera hydrolytica TaxID=3242702 RepID=A0ABV4U891_9BACT